MLVRIIIFQAEDENQTLTTDDVSFEELFAGDTELAESSQLVDESDGALPEITEESGRQGEDKTASEDSGVEETKIVAAEENINEFQAEISSEQIKADDDEDDALTFPSVEELLAEEPEMESAPDLEMEKYPEEIAENTDSNEDAIHAEPVNNELMSDGTNGDDAVSFSDLIQQLKRGCMDNSRPQYPSQ